jgi:hypothetical protein
MYKKKLIPISFMLLSLFASKDVFALELGLTPSHVYGLWSNVNQALTGLANARTDNNTLINQLNNMTPGSFSGKTPGDVLKHATTFRNKLDQLKKQHNLEKTNAIVLSDKEKITPSVVFLNSGNILDSLVLLVIDSTAKNKPVAHYFKTQDVSSKKPSDVYAMVDIANRRLDHIIANTSI